jgi:hypothetical protein
MEKDDKKKKAQRKARAQLDRGKWHQGSEEEKDKEDDEEEEEEGDDGVQWDMLQDDNVDLSSLQLAYQDLDSSFQVLGPFPYHTKGNGPSELTEAGHSTSSGPSE